MDWKFFLQMMVTFLVAALGWVAAHWFTSKRELENERRKIIVELLLGAYRKLEGAMHREDGKTPWNDIESAFADIQLLGSHHQATCAAKLAEAMAAKQDASFDALLEDLRSSLRSELSLPPMSARAIHFRWVPHSHNLSVKRDGEKTRRPLP
jgi:hypothetical protein